MSGDYSRISFDPIRDFCAVLMQQGRVQLDSDWNEWVAIVDRRLRAGTLDTIGRAVVPRETADGFRIQAVGGVLRILPGRIYVDGILAENHGAGVATWDERLAEQRHADWINYTAQPYFPSPPALQPGGPHVVYLDVWQREVTHLMQPDLVEKAIGVDTTTRQQSVWQVKLWPNVANNVTCATPLTDLEGWTAANSPSTARLTTTSMHGGNADDPCLAPPTAGYTGLENQLYRIEIHTPGGAGAARFKWSRDDGSVATRVSTITGNTRLVVESIFRDSLLRFSDGDWVEITDDWRELNGLPGEIRRIKIGGGVDDATRTIVLDTALTAGMFPVDGQDNTNPARHTRIQRWDQRGKILRADGTVFLDLDAPGADGLIPVPPAGTQLQIEQGILVEFSGSSKRLDYWTFAARAVDGWVQPLNLAPPRGIHHHYAKLAIVTFPDNETDCRTLWPPIFEGNECACTVCVSADGHNSGQATIQQAIDSVVERGGTVCLEPGTYRLREPITLANCIGVRVRGHGVATVLLGGEAGAVFRVRDVRSCAIEDLALAGSAREREDIISITHVMDLTLRRLYALSLRESDNVGRLIGLAGVALGLRVDDCVLFGDAPIGIAAAAEEKYFFGAEIRIDDNMLIARTRGIDLGGPAVFAERLRINGNTVIGARDFSVTVSGASLPGCNTHIKENTINAGGTGVVVGVSDATIAGNQYMALRRAGGDGIRIEGGLMTDGLRRLQIVNNRIVSAPAVGIRIAALVHGGIIKQNQIDDAGIAGISVEAGGASELSIDNNQIADVGANVDTEGEVYGGVRVVAARRVDIRGNHVARVGRRAARARAVAGISVLAADHVSIIGNHVSGIGAFEGFISIVDGIVLFGPQLDADVSGNSVQRRDDADIRMGDGRWSGIRMPWAEERLVNYTTKTHGVVLTSKATALAFLADRVLVLNEAPRNVVVCGNRVQAQNSRLPYVWIEQTRTTIFSQNQVEVAPNGAPMEPLVLLQNGSFTVQANAVRSLGDLITMRISGSRSSLPIGNLTTGAILIDGQVLAPPFDALNSIIA